jgi:hypothetical protein
MNSHELTVEELQQQATELFRNEIGVWEARWEFLSPSGEITAEATGTQTMSFAISDRVMLVVMDVPQLSIKSVTHRFFQPSQKRILWISVDKEGDQWTFIEDPNKNVGTSLPHINEDGSTSWLRFTSLRQELNESDVLMELTQDQETWIPIFRQYRDRRMS